MVVQIETVIVRPGREHLYGASAAQRDMEELSEKFEKFVGSNLVVLFDFSDATSISGSYLRATIGWCLNCGKMHVEGATRSDFSDSWGLRPIALYPLVAAKARETIWEIHDFLKHREMACLLVNQEEQPPFEAVEILGSLDEFLLLTMHKISAMGSASAQSLKDASKEKITVGGWSNRLTALLAQRLVLRHKEGKTWKYEILGKEQKLWD